MNGPTARTVRKRRGRPPGPSNSVWPHRVVIFVTGPELQRLRELVDASGKSLSAMVHDLVSLGLEHPELLLSVETEESHKRYPE